MLSKDVPPITNGLREPHLGESQTRRNNLLLDSSGVIGLFGYLAIAWFSKGTYSAPDVSTFYMLIAWVSIPVLFVFTWSQNSNIELSANRILFWAVLFRLAGLLGEPLFEDDHFRYLWDGYRFAVDGNPYTFAPATFFADETVPTVFRGILNQINYPDVPTIYGPTIQLVFLLSHLTAPGSLVPIQIVLIALDIVLIKLLFSMSHRRFVLLYAWCPLVIKEIAFTGHPDGMAVLLMLLAFYFRRVHWFRLAGGFMALAVGAKIFAILLVPFFLVRSNFKLVTTFVLTLMILYVPFAVTGATEFAALSVFARDWEFNSAIYGLLTLVLEPSPTKFLLGGLGLIVIGSILVRYHSQGRDEIPRGDIIFGVFLALAPVINSWYAIWFLTFAVIYPSRWAWTASFALLLAYMTGLNLGSDDLQPFEIPVYVRVLEFSLISLAVSLDVLRQRRAPRLE